MKDRARIEDEDIEMAKEDAKQFACNKIVNFVEANNCDAEGCMDECDVACLRDEADAIVKFCEKINKCRNIKALEKLMYNHYDEKEVKEALGI